ncbi:hypothetical protein [uncultured Roseobacter sp.]|uniref:hypothetical protein n=1 Tax=uncultured Roseobacter sp. TaxID=114847 RepID=UPI002607F3AC|nr:hypothetical protein [uncultured Roseobacter sp.]
MADKYKALWTRLQHVREILSDEVTWRVIVDGFPSTTSGGGDMPAPPTDFKAEVID